jgi:hypothetical protein
MHTEPLPKIKALLVTPSGTDACLVSQTSIGPKDRHASKRLAGHYEAPIETGYLREIFPGHVVRWVHNGHSDDFPADPRIPSWTLPNVNFKVWGPGLIMGFRDLQFVDCTITMGQLMEALMGAGPRKSALLRPL